MNERDVFSDWLWSVTNKPWSSPDAEAAFVGCIIKTGEFADVAASIVQPVDLKDIRLRVIYGAALDAWGTKRPYDTHALWIGGLNANAAKIDASWLMGLEDAGIPAEASVRYYGKIIREWAVKRKLLAHLCKVLKDIEGLTAPETASRLTDIARSLPEMITAEGQAVAVPIGSIMGQLKDIRWLWHPWLPYGLVTLLAAMPGEGKSALALEIARRTLLGEIPWPDGQAAPATGPVLYVDTEGGTAILAQRVRDWGVPTDRLHVMAYPNGGGMANLYLDKPDDWNRLVHWTFEISPQLVIIDSLSGGHSGDENSAAMRGLMKQLASLAQESGAAMLVVHHLRKKTAFETEKITLDRLRGSGAIGQFARVVMALERPDFDNPMRRLVQIKNNLAEPPLPFGVRVDGSGVRFDAPPEAPHAETQTDRAAEFLEGILREKSMPAGEVFRVGHEAGFSDETMRRAARKIKAEMGPDPESPRTWVWRLQTLAAEQGGAKA